MLANDKKKVNSASKLELALDSSQGSSSSEGFALKKTAAARRALRATFSEHPDEIYHNMERLMFEDLASQTLGPGSMGGVPLKDHQLQDWLCRGPRCHDCWSLRLGQGQGLLGAPATRSNGDRADPRRRAEPGANSPDGCLSEPSKSQRAGWREPLLQTAVDPSGQKCHWGTSEIRRTSSPSAKTYRQSHAQADQGGRRRGAHLGDEEKGKGESQGNSKCSGRDGDS